MKLYLFIINSILAFKIDYKMGNTCFKEIRNFIAFDLLNYSKQGK